MIAVGLAEMMEGEEDPETRRESFLRGCSIRVISNYAVITDDGAYLRVYKPLPFYCKLLNKLC